MISKLTTFHALVLSWALGVTSLSLSELSPFWAPRPAPFGSWAPPPPPPPYLPHKEVVQQLAILHFGNIAISSSIYSIVGLL